MGEYRVIKSQFGYNGKKYRTGETVELSDKDALFFIDQKVVVALVEDRVPNEADGLFKELRDEISSLKDVIEKQKAEIANLTSELKAKDLQIKNLSAKKTR